MSAIESEKKGSAGELQWFTKLDLLVKYHQNDKVEHIVFQGVADDILG